MSDDHNNDDKLKNIIEEFKKILMNGKNLLNNDAVAQL